MTMGSNNYGQRVRDVVAAGKLIERWDFTQPCQILSVRNISSVSVPDLQDIEGMGDVVTGETINRRIKHFDGDVRVYWFGNGHFGLCLIDECEAHYIIRDTRADRLNEIEKFKTLQTVDPLSPQGQQGPRGTPILT